tara:strand:+ start:295 stop:1080 length:786 start_codon:yes stop_codon:yes gene_type:complete
MSCYSYKTINETNNPILKNVDITIILIMENSDRFKYDPFLLNLSKKTVFQYNKGFRACKKPSTIIKSNNDIIHAYYTAFEYTKDMNNIIILEEDAEVLYYTKSHYDIVDNYISNDFKVFSFATNGVFKKLDENFYSVDVAHGAQAQIFSKQERLTIMRAMENNKFRGEIDATYLKNNVVVYKHPLIIQLFPETENFNNWSGNKTLNRLGITITELDKNKSGWETIYILSKIRGQINFNSVFLIFILSLFVLFIYRKKSILK